VSVNGTYSEGRIVQQKQHGTLILRIKGTTDLSLVISLENSVLGVIRLGQRKIVIDLRDVASTDPVFVSSLIRMQEAMTASGGGLRFANAPLGMAQALAVSGLRQRFSIFDTVEDVLRTFEH